MTGGRRPASVIVPVYRHQPYLQAAIESILQLEYEPLEIVIRDDASPDDAFDVLKRLVDGYRGPHRIKLARNTTNMAMGNYNRLMEDATARHIIVAHDDDIQMPNRVSRIMDVFESDGVSMVSSNMVRIDADGRRRGLQVPNGRDGRIAVTDLARHGWRNTTDGASLSWDRAVFDIFGPIDPNRTTRTSDWILPFRASLLNGVHFIGDPLLHKRGHVTSRGSFNKTSRLPEINEVEMMSEDITQISYLLATLEEYAKGHPERCDVDDLRDRLLKCLAERADVLALSRNKLFLNNLRMVWLDRNQGDKVDAERLLDLQYRLAAIEATPLWRTATVSRKVASRLRRIGEHLLRR